VARLLIVGAQERWRRFPRQREFTWAREGPWTRKPDAHVPEAERPETYAYSRLNLYHVTTNLAGVRASQALRSRTQLGPVPGLGGGYRDVAAGAISTAYSYEKARDIYDALQYICELVRGKFTATHVLDDLLARFGDYDLDDPDLVAVLQRFVPRQVIPTSRFEDVLNARVRSPEQLYDFYVAVEDALHLGRSYDTDFITPRVGFTQPYAVMKSIRCEQIAILQLAVRRGAQGEHVAEEQEVRFRPEDVRVVRYLQP
jgi:hypothetical protein